MNWYFEVLKKYATFTGRARRKEYWMFMLFNVIIASLLYAIDIALESGGIISGIYLLATFLPGLAVSIRRLHDTGRSGWWYLLNVVPLIGPIIVLVFLCMDSQTGNNQDSTTGNNKYGANPKLESIK